MDRKNGEGKNGQTRSNSTGGTFSSTDTDGDGRISRSEAASDADLGRGFSQADKNSDGYLDNSEYTGRSQTGTDSSSSSSSSSDSTTTTTPTTPPQQ